MKFRLVEDTKFSLNESKVFRVDYKYTNGGKTYKDYAYVIGNNKHTVDFMQDKNNLQKYYLTKTDSNDLVDKEFVNRIPFIIGGSIVAKELTDGDMELVKSYHLKQDKYGNKGHRTDRSHSKIGDDYITHHLCGIEHDKNEKNRIGLNKYDDGEKLHQALHLLTISPNTYKGVRDFEVMVYDTTIETFVPRTLVLRVDIR